MTKKIAIVGATGYTGSELVRILKRHPNVSIELITSESHKGKKFSEIHPQFRGIVDTKLQSADAVAQHKPDLVFLALPHGVSMNFVKKFSNESFKIIDLSGDFRLSSPQVYELWYKKTHTFTQGFEQVAFGLPEMYRETIKNARLVANPGCFPTGAILSVLPLVKKQIIKPFPLIFDSKTGVTGAGIKASETTHFPNVNDNFKAYKVKNHRHSVEIQEKLSHAAGQELKIQFTPHLLPVDRGILTTAYSFPVGEISEKQTQQVFSEFYEKETFIRFSDQLPDLKNVRATNFVDIFATFDPRTQTIIAISAIDNLMRGAAGQAVQNMNLMLGLPENTGLDEIPVKP